MNVSIHEAWAEISAFQVDGFSGLVIADSGDPTPDDGDVARLDFVGDHIDDSGVFENQIGRAAARGNVDEIP